MRRTVLLAAGVAGLLVPGHASASAPATEAAPVIQYSSVPNQPVDDALWLRATPQVSIWADGRLIATDPILRRGEWILPQLAIGTVDPDAVADLLAQAATAGLLAGGQDYGQPFDHGPHAPMTELVLRDGDDTWTHTAYGLDLRPGEELDRGVLATYISDVVAFSAANAAELTSWVPDAIAIRATPATGVDPSVVVDWPATGPNLGASAECVVARDAATIALVRDSLTSARFTDDGEIWQIAARPVLPGVPAC